MYQIKREDWDTRISNHRERWHEFSFE